MEAALWNVFGGKKRHEILEETECFASRKWRVMYRDNGVSRHQLNSCRTCPTYSPCDVWAFGMLKHEIQQQ
jgi:hypothetical protein